MAVADPAGLQRSAWIGLFGGWVASGLAVAVAKVGGIGAVIAFVAGFLIVAGLAYERRLRLQERSFPDGPPSPWDGVAWEGWLALAAKVLAGLVAVRLLTTVDWSQWKSIFWQL